MKTNLIFKKQSTYEGVLKVVTRIVPVDIPQINSGEGWTLSGHTDIVEVISSEETDVEPNNVQKSSEEDNKNVSKNSSKVDEDFTKFISDVPGTAKLVRHKGCIRIVARRGKSTYNQTTPNSVCISDLMKNEFFKMCREVHGNVGCFEFRTSDGKPYDIWNARIDSEYIRQKKKVTSTTL